MKGQRAGKATRSPDELPGPRITQREAVRCNFHDDGGPSRVARAKGRLWPLGFRVSGTRKRLERLWMSERKIKVGLAVVGFVFFFLGY